MVRTVARVAVCAFLAAAPASAPAQDPPAAQPDSSQAEAPSKQSETSGAGAADASATRESAGTALEAVSDPGATAAGMPADHPGREGDDATSADHVMEAPAPPARILVRGTLFEGTITRLNAKQVEFEPSVGRGKVTFKYDEIDDISTTEAFHFFDEDGNSYTGTIIGMQGEGLLVGGERDSAAWLPFDGIAVGVREEEYDSSFMTRARTKFNHWTAVVDLGLEIDSGAVEKRKVNTSLTIERRKRPWVTRYFAEYAFESQKQNNANPPQPRQTTKDEFRSYLDVWRDIGGTDWFGFFFAGGEFDKPRNIESRIYPAGGVGYRLVDEKRGGLELRGGMGGVFEEFKNTQDPNQPPPQNPPANEREYGAVFIAGNGQVKLPRNSELTGFVMYMPSVDGPAENWLFRFDLALTIPIFDPLALRVRLSEVLDNNPTLNTGNNKTVTTVAFALRF